MLNDVFRILTRLGTCTHMATKRLVFQRGPFIFVGTKAGDETHDKCLVIVIM